MWLVLRESREAGDIIHADSSHLCEIYSDVATIRRSFPTKFRQAGFTDLGTQRGGQCHTRHVDHGESILCKSFTGCSPTASTHTVTEHQPIPTGVALVKCYEVDSTKICLLRVICPFLLFGKREFRESESLAPGSTNRRDESASRRGGKKKFFV